jgi:serine/threonine protein kinase
MIDEFVLVRLIEKGFTATVYEAECGGRSFALKKYEPNMLIFARQEYELASRLNHPNIIRYLCLRETALHRLSSDSQEACCVVVLEYAIGGELTHLLQKVGGMTEELARTYFHMLIDAIEHMHTLGVYHLDIKPQNILLDCGFQLKLTDFGFSSLQRVSSSNLGTDGYAAPEILTQTHYNCELADVFSCGVVLFILVFRELPFASSHPEDPRRVLLSQSPNEFWDRLPEKTPELKALLSLMLDEDSSKRLSLPDIRKHPWFSGDVLMGYQVT